MELKRRCPGCGAPLPEEASFCPFCASSVNQRTALEPPSLRRLLLLRLAALLAALAAAALALFLLTRPRTFDGQGEVVYTDGDGSYQLVLGAAEDRYAPVRERRQNAAVGEEYRFPVYLYVNHTGSGADAGQLFLRKVASVEAERLPVEEGVGAVSCTQPAPDDYFPGAALVSYVDYTARDAFTTQLVLTLTMDNGDEVRLRQDLHVTPIRTYEYRPGDVPMDTLADLQALVDEIAATVEPSAQVDLYLPPVTYEGSLVMEERPVNLYGSEEDGRRTAFTGTLRVASRDSWIVYVKGIDFVGDGSGVGISASARLWVEECSFTGWKTGGAGLRRRLGERYGLRLHRQQDRLPLQQRGGHRQRQPVCGQPVPGQRRRREAGAGAHQRDPQFRRQRVLRQRHGHRKHQPAAHRHHHGGL